MLAVKMYKPRDLRVEDVPIPSPQEGWALLKVRAVGICGSDVPRVNKYGAHVSPIIVGHEFSAEVAELGPNTAGVNVGDRVTVAPLIPCGECPACRRGQYSLCEHYDYVGSRRDGAFAEYVVAPVANLLVLPDEVDDWTAATTDPCANAVHGLMQGRIQPGEAVCVYGAGAIGLFAIQCAKAFGAKTVISVDIQDEKLEVARACGADEAINSLREDAPARIRALTGGCDLVLDVAGSPISQANAIESAGREGRVVLLGISHQPLPLTEKQVDRIMRMQLSVIGSWNSFGMPFPGRDWTISLDLFKKGLVTAEPIITHRLPLTDAPEIFRQIDERKLFYNKILFYP